MCVREAGVKKTNNNFKNTGILVVFCLLQISAHCTRFAVTAWLDSEDLHINAYVSMHASVCVCVYVCGRTEDRRGLRRC